MRNEPELATMGQRQWSNTGRWARAWAWARVGGGGCPQTASSSFLFLLAVHTETWSYPGTSIYEKYDERGSWEASKQEEPRAKRDW